MKYLIIIIIVLSLLILSPNGVGGLLSRVRGLFGGLFSTVKEPFLSNVLHQKMYFNDEAVDGFNSYDKPCQLTRDPHCYLLSSVIPGNSITNNVNPVSESINDSIMKSTCYGFDASSTYSFQKLVNDSAHQDPPIKSKTLENIKQLQPRILGDKPCVKNIYGHYYFNDNRFPRELVRVKYADPNILVDKCGNFDDKVICDIEYPTYEMYKKY